MDFCPASRISITQQKMSRPKGMDLTIRTSDNYLLSATLFQPDVYDHHKNVIVGCAIGVKKAYYEDFAVFLQQSM